MNNKVGVFLILGLLVFSMGFSSAGWFSDAWNKITGNTITGNAVANTQTITKNCGSLSKNSGCSISFSDLGGSTSVSATFKAKGDFGAAGRECLQIKEDDVVVSGPLCGFAQDSWYTLASNVNVLNKVSSSGSLSFFCNTYGDASVDGYTCEISITYTKPTTCTSFTYSPWSECINGQQTRTIASQSPSGCTGGSPVLSQSCTPPVNTCTSFTYSPWSECADGVRTRTIMDKLPSGCTGGSSDVLTIGCGGNGFTCTSNLNCGDNLVETVCDSSRSCTRETTYSCLSGTCSASAALDCNDCAGGCNSLTGLCNAVTGIECNSNAECNSVNSDSFCSNEQRCYNRTNFVCTNPGTTSSDCVESNIEQVCSFCGDGMNCLSGQCVPESVACVSNADCASVSSVGFCSENKVCQNITQRVCQNPNTIQSACVETALVTQNCGSVCENGCENGLCIIPGCESDWSCSLTPESCPKNGIQTENCIDLNGCSSPTNRIVACEAPEVCLGCSYEGNCVQFGYRANSQYCDVDKAMKSQISGVGSSCENNYECRSNICSDGVCYEAVNASELRGFFGMWARLSCRFSDWFGMQEYNSCLSEYSNRNEQGSCGDGFCADSETNETCPSDCANFCDNDEICEMGENPRRCGDCGSGSGGDGVTSGGDNNFAVYLYNVEDSELITRNVNYDVYYGYSGSSARSCDLYLDNVLVENDNSVDLMPNHNLFALRDLNLGIHTVYISCSDSSGRISNSSIDSFVVQAPSPNSPRIVLESIVSNNNPNRIVYYNVSDLDSFDFSCSLYVNNVLNQTQDVIFGRNNFSLTDLRSASDDVNYNVYVSCSDGENIGVSNEQSFTVNRLVFLPGSGTAEDPYNLYNCSDLAEMREPNAYYQLQQDLDCSDSANWEGGFIIRDIPIFNGTLLGNGYTIYAITILKPNQDNVGIFSQVENATISNLNIVEATIRGKNNVGGLVGNVIKSVIITNVSAIRSNIRGSGYVGGFVGRIGDNQFSVIKIINSSSAGNIIATPSSGLSVSQVGGLLGGFYNGFKGVSLISDSHSSMSIFSDNEYHNIDNCGGLVGELDSKYDYPSSHIIERSYNEGNLNPGSNYGCGDFSRVGGLVGNAERLSIVKSFNTGNVFAGCQEAVGGLVGNSYNLAISSSYNLGNINTTYYHAAGLVGYVASSATISNSFNAGNVFAGQGKAAGLAGEFSSSTITNSFNIGNVSSQKDLVGIGKNTPGMTNSFNAGRIINTSIVPSSNFYSALYVNCNDGCNTRNYIWNETCPVEYCTHQGIEVQDINYFKGDVQSKVPFSGWTFGQASGWKSVKQANCGFDGYPILYWMPDCFNIETGRVGA